MVFTRGERWVATIALIAVGVSQLFRSDVENVIGAFYIGAAVTWMIAARHGIYWQAVAEFFVGIVLMSRGFSALAVQTSGNWSGPVIVFATWTATGAMFMRFGWLGMSGRGVIAAPKHHKG